MTLACDGQRVETKAGATALIGLARATRGDGSTLVEGAFRADLTGYLVDRTAEPPRPGWLAGPVAGLSHERWVVGAQVVTPPLRVWRFSVRGSATVGAGNGERFGTIGILFGK